VDVFVFVFGLFVTVVAGGAIGTIWWAAFGDGERNDAYRRAELAAEDDSELRPAA
jgi:hypothetical protein